MGPGRRAGQRAFAVQQNEAFRILKFCVGQRGRLDSFRETLAEVSL